MNNTKLTERVREMVMKVYDEINEKQQQQQNY